jgi:O-antigen/teichoic acid export membrane protein
MELSLNKQMGFLFGSRIVAFVFLFMIPLVLARVFSIEEFGHYKQLFLIHETLWMCLSLGLSASLYYFIPLYLREWRAYVYQTLFLVACLGIAGAGGLVVFRSQVASLLNSPDIEPYLPYLAMYTGISLVTSNLENIMVILKQSRLVALTTVLSDFLRALLMIGAAVWTHSMLLLVLAALIWMICRLIMLLVYLRALGVSWWVRLDQARVREQVRYSIPFGLAIIAGTLADSMHQYVVSYVFNPTIFAIYAVGCFQIPVVEIIFGSVSDVALVRLAELQKDGQHDERVKIIGDSVVKVCLLLLPLYVWLTVNARSVIVLLFTERFEASADIFRVYLTVILLLAFQLDYVPRVFADTRFIFRLYIMRLMMTGLFLALLVTPLGVLGAALATVLASGITRVLMTLRVKFLLKVTLFQLLPWNQLGKISLSSFGAGCIIWAFQTMVNIDNLVMQLIVSASIFAILYAVFVWYFNGIEAEQKCWIIRRMDQVYRALSGGVAVVW